jgi:hypothetical protein
MSQYRIRSTGEIQSEMQIRAANSHRSLPRVWNDNVFDLLGIDPVFASTKPAPSSDYKIVVRDGVEQNDQGEWVWAWTENDMFQEYTDNEGNLVTVQVQIDASLAKRNDELSETIRVERNTLLAETDWISLKALESGQAPSAEMVAYRQALRDVPSQAGFPGEITWPTKPE